VATQESNCNLKENIALTGIRKAISLHCARHTFVTVSLDLGISMDVVQSILEHTDSKMTAISGKIRDGLKEREMGKWG